MLCQRKRKSCCSWREGEWGVQDEMREHKVQKEGVVLGKEFLKKVWRTFSAKKKHIKTPDSGS